MDIYLNVFSSKQYGPNSCVRPVRTDRMTNLSSEDAEFSFPIDVPLEHLIARIYEVTDAGISSPGTYPTATLDVTKTTDEDGHISYEFKDKSGKTILTRQLEGDNKHDTYMVYDNYDNVRMVLPPLAADGLTGNSSWTETNDVLKKYAYIYHYDKYNRCIYKKLPGCEPLYTIYDAADRPVFTQDGNQRDKGEWSFCIVDGLGRVALTGTCKNTLSYTADPLKNKQVKATCVKETNVLKGYRVSGYTLNTPTVLSANYYDDYTFLGYNGILNNASTAYSTETGYGKQYSGGCRGQQTGAWTARLSKTGVTGTPLYTVMYYDERYRVIQQKGNNELGGTDQLFTAYNFNGQPTKVKQIRTVPGKDTMTELRTHTYDNADRLLKTTYQLNSETPVILVDNVYDEVGRLKTERHNGNVKLKTDYTYNVRSWTKNITGLLFNQTLNYQEEIAGNTSCYNGNISSMSWKSVNDTAERGYHFTYDSLSRLKDAIYGEGTALAINPNRFNEQITGYDKMGNILGLKRYGQTSASNYGLIDNLTLTYNGNQLQAVKDIATGAVYGNGTEFKDGTNQTTEYTYDKNGNLIKDLNKNLSTIQYNLLNLPSQVILAGSNSIDYEYGADGTKLRTVHKTGTTTLTTDYCGNAIYENGVLKMLLNEAGHVSFPDKKFHFHLKDHQGNTRVVADKDGNVEESNAYYPFGGTYTSTASVQPYKYNGKELDTNNGLNWYDYGARHYDAAIGRWHVVDPMNDKYYSSSPYNYCDNEPIGRIDPNGEDWIRDRFGSYLWDDNATDQDSTPYGWTYVGSNLPDDASRYQVLEEIDGELYHKNTINPFASLVNAIFGEGTMVEKKAYDPEGDHMMEQFVETGADYVIGEVGGKAIKWGVGKVFSKAFDSKLVPLGNGVTGRTTATSLTEQLAMEEIMSNPAIGKIIPKMEPLSDPRWLGWNKMQYIHTALDGSKTVIHYVGKYKNGFLKYVDDFKFK